MTTVTIGGQTYTIGGPSGPAPVGGSTQSNSPTGVSSNSTKALYPTGLTGPQNVYQAQGPQGVLGPNGQAGAAPSPMGLGGALTQFGTNVNATPYTSNDAWTIPPDQVPLVKQQLVQAGLLSPRYLGNPGVMDVNAATAYEKVLTFANAYGMTATDALKYYVNNPVGTAAGGTSGASGGGFNASVFFPEYNPANIATGFRSTAQALTGQENGGMLPQFQSAFKAAEAQAAVGKDTAKIAKQGALAAGNLGAGQYEQKPTPADFAQQYLIHNDPQQVQAYALASRGLEFLSMLGIH
jgi:hypothetical protein